MLTCKHASRLVSEGHERDLNPLERIHLHLHLWMCSHCRHFKKQIDQLRLTVRQGWSRGDIPAKKPLPAEARERIRKTLGEQSGHPDG